MTNEKSKYNNYSMKIITYPFSIYIKHSPTELESRCGWYRKQLKNIGIAMKQLNLDLQLMRDYS